MSSNFLKKYILKELLGSGASADVYKVQKKNTNEHYAVKIFELLKLDQYDNLLLEKELEVNQILNDKNIVKLIEYFKDSVEIYAIFELCPYGDLRCQILSKAFKYNIQKIKGFQKTKL